jgi:hypothetical protein
VRGVSRRHLEALRKYLGREGEMEDDGVVEEEPASDPVA